MKYEIEITPDNGYGSNTMGDLAEQTDRLRQNFDADRIKWDKVATSPAKWDLEIRHVDGRKWQTSYVFDNPADPYVTFNHGTTAFLVSEAAGPVAEFRAHMLYLVSQYPTLTNILIKITGV